MVQIPLGLNDWQSEERHTGRLKMRNMYIAENPFSVDGVTRFSRPSLDSYITVGSGPIKGIWRQDGAFDGNWFVVSNQELYIVNDATRSVSLVGSLPGTDYCDFAGNEDKVVIVRNSVAYAYNGTTLTAIVMPDNLPVKTVDQIDGTFLLGIEDSYRFYWMLPSESAPDPLSFASAERLPDYLTSIKVLSDEIWFIGTDSVEVWAQTGDIDAPYARIAGRAYTEGCIDQATIASSSYKSFPCLLWVTNSREVVLSQGQPNIISNQSVEELLKTATNLRAWVFRRTRCDFYVISFDQATLVFNLTNSSWSRWDTLYFNYWRGHLGIMKDADAYAGDSESNRIFLLGQNSEDIEDIPIVCQVSGFVGWPGKQESCASVNIRTNAGWSPSYVNPLPIIELRWSDNYGFTWSTPMQLSLGAAGQYNGDITFRSLGLIKRPGRLFEISYTGLQNFLIDYATMNEV